ncbi:PLAC8-domain-containing protein [Marasmius fiardii PR-910]|nr:PLAC8-domain-containing protein [Marasmius fiardii PR-910]
MSISTDFKGSRNAKCLPTGSDGRRDWSTGLFSCYKEHTFGDWALACFCPCITYGRNRARLDHLTQQNRPDPVGRETTHNVDCCLHCCMCTFCLFGWALLIPNRAVLRTRYRIRGSFLSDCCLSLCCSSCTLTQESLEIELEESSFPGIG